MEAWNEAWATEAGRREWLEPDRFVVELLPLLRAWSMACPTMPRLWRRFFSAWRP